MSGQRRRVGVGSAFEQNAVLERERQIDRLSLGHLVDRRVALDHLARLIVDDVLDEAAAEHVRLRAISQRPASHLGHPNTESLVRRPTPGSSTSSFTG